MNNDVESSEGVAPCTQHNDEQDQNDALIGAELSDCFNPEKDRENNDTYNLLDDFGIFPRANDDEELLVYRMEDNRYRELVRSLNKEQMEFFYHVLHSVKTTSNQLTLFLSGGAGCGKTTVTNCLYKCLIRYLNSAGENPDEMKVLKLAPTGKAAFIINGNTLHSALKIPVNRGFEYCRLDNDRLNTMRALFKDLRLIFIDEISMVGYHLFQFLNWRLKEVMNVTKPFGGVHIITVGDLFQLKPVFDSWIFENSLQGYGCLSTNVWQKYFCMYELTEIMRQKDDKHFAELLNRVREGKHTQRDINTLETRVCRDDSCHNESLINITHVFPTNASVDSHNRAVFEKSTSCKARIKAIDVVIGDLSDQLKERMKEKIPSDPSKTMGLFSVVDVAVGLKYDLTTNISVLDGMTNGAEFILKKIDYRILTSTRPSILWVLFEQSSIGRNWRARYPHLYNKSTDKNWTPLLEITRHFKINKRSEAQIMRRQFPLRAAAGKTIHRCQGDTLSEIVIEFPGSRRDHMHYVGLSRVRNLSSLRILRLNEKKITVSEKVVAEMARLRKEAMLELCVPFLYSKADNVFKILFQNVRSLPLHFKDVAADYSVKSVDAAILVETGLCTAHSNTDFALKYFDMYRNDYYVNSSSRSMYGTIVYIRNTVGCVCGGVRYNYNGVEITVTIVNQPVKNLHIISIYRSKSKVVLRNFINALDYVHETVLHGRKVPTVLLGDFNVNLVGLNSEKTALERNLIENRGYTQLIKNFTTDYQSTIDHIYTNLIDLVESCGTLESYYSDHKPIFVCFRAEKHLSE